ncbi:hypothetical protein FGG08_000503 [Glutinoglossum americanum]|uniref:Zn(2)-C6 fungal-type domain-containing protein n=1 Tax=Glutinoglossum americanum TaxID=1670608 RepID=A0A9P8IG96_9PEZI|nr:hypothetical protein FGG08_000503 [Glutinoglossum americanum]
MAVVNGRSDDSAAFSQLLSAAEAVSADNINSSPMTAIADHSNIGRGPSGVAIAVGGPAHESFHPSDVRSRSEQVNGTVDTERPHKRRKVALACDGCRERKTRCDGERPICGSCKRRSRQPGQCIYKTETMRVSVADGSIEALHNRIRELETRYRIDGSSPGSNNHVPPTSHVVDMTESPPRFSPGQDHSHTLLNRPLSVDHILAPPWQPTQNGPGDYGPQARPGGATSNGHGPTRSLTTTSQPIPLPMLQNGVNTAPENLDMGEVRPASLQALDDQDRVDNQSPTGPLGALSLVNGNDPGGGGHLFDGQPTAPFTKQLVEAISWKTENSDDPISSQSAQRPPTVAFDDMGDKSRKPNPLALLCEESPSLKLEDFVLPPRHVADHLISRYWTTCATLYPFLHEPTFSLAYRKLWASDRENIKLVPSPGAGLGNSIDGDPDMSIFFCALNAIFAIGCEFSDIPIDKRSATSNMFFQRSKHLLRLDVLDNGSISLVQTLLLVAQYLQCTSYPTRCWNSIGIACRVAQGLGLHLEDNKKQLPSLELEVRRRTWYGCVTLDMYNPLLPIRPLNLGSDVDKLFCQGAIDDEYLEPGAFNCVQPADEFSRSNFFVEAIKLYKILGNILSSVYEPWINGTGRGNSDPVGFEHLQNTKGFDMIMSLDSALMKFYSETPALLKSPKSETCTAKLNRENPDTLRRQANVLYLHLRILLYRPIFTQLCRSSSSASLAAEPTGKPSADGLANKSEDTMTSFFATRCAVSCVTAAMELINIINKNMNTTGAWWYNMFYTHTAGMVLIMANVCIPIQEFLNMASLEESWRDCQDSLAQMASYSATAKRCLKGLRSLHSRVYSRDTGMSLLLHTLIDLRKRPHHSRLNAARIASLSKPLSPTTNGTALGHQRHQRDNSSSTNDSSHHRPKDPTDVASILNSEDCLGKQEQPPPSEIEDTPASMVLDEQEGIDGEWWNGPTFDLFLEGSPNELDPGL